MKNLFADIPSQLPEELAEAIVETKAVVIKRIISLSHASPEGFWYDQPQHEWVVLLRGAATLRFKDEVVEMKPGDWIDIPAHRGHRVEWTTPDEPTIWLAVHYND